MEKYFATVSNSIKKNLVYRVNSIITMFSVFFSSVVLFYFWTSIYRQGNQIGSYSMTQMVSYYIYLTIFELLIMNLDISWGIGEEIKNGQIISNILKPINYLKYKFSQSFGGLLYRLLIFMPAIMLVLFLLKNYLAHAESSMVYLVFVFSALISFLLYFFIYCIVGIISFWTADFYGFLFACFVTISFMQGALLPLDLLPRWFISLSHFLPFQYLFFVPVSFVTGRISFTWSMLFIPLLWCFGLYFFAQILFLKGIKRYESYGI